jgi:phage-related protein
MDGLKVTIGSAVLPVLVELLKAFAAILKPVASAIRGSGALRAVLGPLAVGLGVLAVALKIASVAMLFGAAAATALWAALGVGIIAAIIAAFVVLYQKVGWFRDAVNAVWNFIKTYWPLLGAFILGPLAPIILLATNFGGLRDKAVAAFRAIVGAIGSVIGAIGNVIGAIGRAAAAFGQKIAEMAGFVASLPGRIAGAALAAGKALIEGIANGIKSAGDAIMSAIESVVPEPIKKVLGGIKGFLEKISPFQSGGLVPSGGRLALVGEAGPELLSLPGGSQVIPLQAGTAPAINVGALGGEIHVHLEVEGRELARAVARVAAETQAAR